MTVISQRDRESRLRAFEIPATTARPRSRHLFSWVLVTSLFAFLGLGGVLRAVDLPPLLVAAQNVQRTRLRLQEPKPKVEIQAPVVEEIAELKAAPTPIAAAEPVEAPEPPPEIPSAAETTPPDAPEQRQVYGVRRVFAKGLGEGGAGGQPIFSRRGNSLSDDAARIDANEADLAGELVPLSAVSTAPALIGRVKPEYTEEMLENRVSGLVRARLLVDNDGSVRSVEVFEDIGHGSKSVAESAFAKLRFDPARRGDKPVAVWITMKFRFEIQE